MRLLLQAVEKLLQKLPATQLFLVQRQGPMSFVLCEDGAESQHKVLLGSKPTCSCRFAIIYFWQCCATAL